MLKNNTFCALFLCLFITRTAAQTRPDTLRTQELKTVQVTANRATLVEPMADVQGTYLMAGRRTEVIRLGDIDADMAQKNPRQLLAKVPGLFVYDMDGSGNQMNISTRGLDPHRSWEMNSRQNGVLINSDCYGYPASHYSVPTESLERIEYVRGTASLQYGAQFGGMLNQVTKQTDTTRRFGLETIGSVGSFALRSTYTAVGGRVGRLTYYVYAYWRASDGYRQNSATNAQAQYARLQYRAGPRLTLTTEVGRSRYVYKTPGPLTDSMFRANLRQSTRSRNYYSPDIWLPSLRADWQVGQRTRLQLLTSAVLGVRNSVLIDAPANVTDLPDSRTGLFRQRQVDIDNFNSYTAEARLLHRFAVLGIPATAVVGAQWMHNDLNRRQLGKGTTGSDYDMTLTGPFVRDLWYYTRNTAFFAESQFHVTPRLTLSPGIRLEAGQTQMRGTIAYYDPATLPTNINRQFTLLGLSGQYRANDQVRVYGGISQAYRPVLFKDVIPASVYERVDQTLRDATGYNAELGLEGTWQGIHLNITAFDLLYRNRMGLLALIDLSTKEAYTLRTNIGTSRSTGVELLLEGTLAQWGRLTLSGFTATAIMDARYTDARVATGTENRSVSGNRVESAPALTTRNGLTIRCLAASLTVQYSYVSMTYSDALNTPVPSVNGARGPVPAYGLLDLNMTWHAGKHVTVRGSLSNALDRQYFTKRPQLYPGGGVWPSDGRTGTVSVGYRL